MSAEGLRADLVVRRGDFELRVAFDVPAGTTTAIVGPNGAGKTTVVDALAGIVPLDEGRVTVGGRILDEPAAGTFVPAHERRVGVVFQGQHLFPRLSVRDNVAFGPRSRGGSRSSARAVAATWLAALDLVELSGRLASELSGGQGQRVALARALATEPDLLVLDEPFSALDAAARVEVRRVLGRQLGDHDGPRVLITHEPTDAFALADRVVVLEGGRITQAGTPDEIRRRPATPYVAALTGVNLLRGTALDGVVQPDEHDQALVVADQERSGPVLLVIPPRAVALHPERPGGSPRNAWPTRVATLETLGEVVRVTLTAPLAIAADVTPAAVEALGLAPGLDVWASVKATEVSVDAA